MAEVPVEEVQNTETVEQPIEQVEFPTVEVQPVENLEPVVEQPVIETPVVEEPVVEPLIEVEAPVAETVVEPVIEEVQPETTVSNYSEPIVPEFITEDFEKEEVSNEQAEISQPEEEIWKF